MLFLVADDERVDEMVQTAQRYLAIARITGDAERMGEFTEEQRKKLKKMGEAAELGYDADSPPPAVQVGDEVYLYLPEEAARLDLPIKGKVKPPLPEGVEGIGPEPACPVCGHPKSHCTCGEGVEFLPRREPLRGEGVPQQAFQQLLDRCHDRRVTRLSILRVILRGDGPSDAPFYLDELTGVRLALILLAVRPLTRHDRIEAIGQGVQAMGDEEAYYWFSKCSAGPDAIHAQRALRILLAGE